MQITDTSLLRIVTTSYPNRNQQSEGYTGFREESWCLIRGPTGRLFPVDGLRAYHLWWTAVGVISQVRA